MTQGLSRKRPPTTQSCLVPQRLKQEPEARSQRPHCTADVPSIVWTFRPTGMQWGHMLEDSQDRKGFPE